MGHGMRSAARIAEIMGLLSGNHREIINDAIKEVGRIPTAKNLAMRDIILAMMRDKKAEAGSIAFVLPVEVGTVVIRTDVDLSAIRQALKETLN